MTYVISDELQADLDRIWAEWLALTHEDIEEGGLGCKSCEKPHSESWWRGSGDIYCFECALRMTRELGDVDFTVVKTREQVRTDAEWAAAGIGCN